MPPKKKGSSKKPAKARTPTLINGLTKEEMTKEQLEEHIVHLREELDREREERNYFQLERDQIQNFWEITERKLEEGKAELENLHKEIEEDEMHNRVEIKVYKQKMKHLLCEHLNTVAELKADGLVSAEAKQKEQERLETKLHKEMRAVVADMQDLESETLDKELKLKHDEEMTRSRNKWEKCLTETVGKKDKKMELMQQELDNLWKSMVSEREHQWNSHINTLQEDYNKALQDTKILVDAMERDINKTFAIKEEISQLQREHKEKKMEVVPILRDSKRLAELVSKAEEENTEVQKKVKYYSEKTDTMEMIKTKELKDLKRDYGALEEKFRELQLERDELDNDIQKLQQKSDAESMELGEKPQALTDSVEQTQAQLTFVLSVSNMDQTALKGIANKVLENIDSANTAIKNLQAPKNLISKARRDLLLTYETKQQALGFISE